MYGVHQIRTPQLGCQRFQYAFQTLEVAQTVEDTITLAKLLGIRYLGVDQYRIY
jgi:hypothetical protein